MKWLLPWSHNKQWSCPHARQQNKWGLLAPGAVPESLPESTAPHPTPLLEGPDLIIRAVKMLLKSPLEATFGSTLRKLATLNKPPLLNSGSKSQLGSPEQWRCPWRGSDCGKWGHTCYLQISVVNQAPSRQAPAGDTIKVKELPREALTFPESGAGNHWRIRKDSLLAVLFDQVLSRVGK